ncbi:ATP-binding protein [Pseudokineococcus sp. 1T1Z-3]|uniref:ATP-binding protein n=1 Tax=Pseudokineococcus sp. 1T1Z-3 TaxID=3132745 RepID=UPI0030B00932
MVALAVDDRAATPRPPLARLLSLVLLAAIALGLPTLVVDLAGPQARALWWRLPVSLAQVVAALMLVRDVVRGTSPTPAAALVWGSWFVSAVVALALGLAGLPGDVPESDRLPAAAVAAVVLCRGVRVLLPVLVLAGVQAWARVVTEARSPGDATDDVVFAVANVVVLAVALRSLEVPAGRLAARRRVAEQTVGSAEQRLSAAAERVRWQAQVHDGVLAVLRLAQEGHRLDPPAALQARRALAALVATNPAATSEAATTTQDLAEEVRESAEAAASGAVVDAQVVPGGLPRPVANAMVSATSECVRNVVRHAGTQGRCRVVVRASPVLVVVTIADEGVGMPRRPRRGDVTLGLRVAVEQRLEVVGGQVAYESAFGRGTTVHLSWRSEGSAWNGAR